MRRSGFTTAMSALVATGILLGVLAGLGIGQIQWPWKSPPTDPPPPIPPPAMTGRADAPARNGPVTVFDCDTEAGYRVERRVKFRASRAGGTETHVLAVYQTRRDHGHGYHPTGTADVTVTRTTPLKLVLKAYEPTVWKIHARPGARIEGVELHGYHTQRATGVPDKMVVQGGQDSSGAVTSSTYCYDASKFSISG